MLLYNLVFKLGSSLKRNNLFINRAMEHGGEPNPLPNPLDNIGLCLLSLDGGGKCVKGVVELKHSPLSQKTKVFCLSGRTRSIPLVSLRLARHTLPPRMIAHRSRSGPATVSCPRPTCHAGPQIPRKTYVVYLRRMMWLQMHARVHV